MPAGGGGWDTELQGGRLGGRSVGSTVGEGRGTGKGAGGVLLQSWG